MNQHNPDRRGFLQALAAAPAVAAFSSKDKAEAERLSQAIAADRPEGLVWDKAPCRYCGTGCGVEVGVQDGKVVAVRGDEKSPVNKGLLCVKGYHLPAMLYGKDRLLHPMLRKDGKLQRISWDEALDLIAEKFGEALREKGPNGVAVYGSGQWTVFDGYAASKWVKGGMKSNNIDPNARLCMASAVMGFVT
ncbi:MAG TPA: twin-arginine translocation signal domain-containing protein, partial [bacterium]|nr:twin-arginine translocation signal domain-containing protein [bacterium]